VENNNKKGTAAQMKTVIKLKRLITVYLSILILLLLCVTATPLIVRHKIAVTSTFIIKEQELETALIGILFGVSYLILKAFLRALKAYKQAADRIVNQKSRLISRLADAFSYIGAVNVEIQEIRSIVCGIEHYPHTKKEFKALLDRLAAKALVVAARPWIVIRIINRCNGRTIKEHSAERTSGSLPSSTMGNREILEGHPAEGLQMITSCQEDLSLLTACILPMPPLSEESRLLMTALVNQTQLLFLLYHTGCFQRALLDTSNGKERHHDYHN
jgi:hypothetical protein